MDNYSEYYGTYPDIYCHIYPDRYLTLSITSTPRKDSAICKSFSRPSSRLCRSPRFSAALYNYIAGICIYNYIYIIFIYYITIYPTTYIWYVNYTMVTIYIYIYNMIELGYFHIYIQYIYITWYTLWLFNIAMV